eukprot:g15560.t1
MALSQNKANIKDDVFTLMVDGNTFPHHLNMRVMLGYIEKDMVSHAVGPTPLGSKVLGHVCEITIDSLQLRAELEDFLDLTSGVPLDVGDDRTEHAVEIHPVSMGADKSDDILIPKAVFGPTIDSAKTGAAEDKGSILIKAVHNPSGPTFRRGPEPV